MNSEQPSREQIEARITALLLGELPVAEAELLRWTISHDPELQKLHDELKVTIGFVREAMKNPTGAPLDRKTRLQLPQDRRQTLLAHFKTARPQPPMEPELSWLRRIKVSPLIPTLAVLAIIAALAAISIPNFVTARSTSKKNSIINNLRQIDAAKNEWALEKGKSLNDVPTANDLTPYLQGQALKPVAGESYVLGRVSQPTVANLNGKVLTSMPENFASADTLSIRTDHAAANTKSQINLALGDRTLETDEASRSPNSEGAIPEKPKVPPTPAPIALPNTESSQVDSDRGEVYSQSVVGYVNISIPPGSSTMVPNQHELAPASPATAETSSGPGVEVTAGASTAGYSSRPPEPPKIEPPSFDFTAGAPSQASATPASASPLASSAAQTTPPAEIFVSPPGSGAPPQQGPIPPTLSALIPPTPAGGNYTLSAAPSPVPSISAPLANGIQPAPEGVSESAGENVAKSTGNAYGGGGIDGAGTANLNNSWHWSANALNSQAQTKSLSDKDTVANGPLEERESRDGIQYALTYATNGTPGPVQYFNFPEGSSSGSVTNAIAMNQAKGFDWYLGNIKDNNQSPLTTREIPNANSAALDSFGLQAAAPSPSAAPPAGIEGSAPVAPVFLPPRLKQQYTQNEKKLNESLKTRQMMETPSSAAESVESSVPAPVALPPQTEPGSIVILGDATNANALGENAAVVVAPTSGPTATRESQNVNTAVQNSGGGLLYVQNSPINPTTGLPEVVNAPALHAPQSQQHDELAYQREEAQIQLDEGNVGQLRKQLNVRDTEPTSTQPTPTISSEQVQQLNEKILEQNALVNQNQKELAELQAIQATNPADLPNALLTVKTDSSLSDLLSKLHENQQKLASESNQLVLGPVPDDASAVALNDTLKQEVANRVNGIMFSLQGQVDADKAGLDALNQRFNEIQGEGQNELKSGQPYWIAKAKLQDEMDLHKLLGEKIEANEADAAMPRSALVTVVASAQPGQSQNLWQRMTGQVESQARIKIEPDVTSAVPIINASYDPYFMETELSSIKSDAVLGRVVDALKLDQTWLNQGDGEKLSRMEAIAQLRSRLDLQSDRNTKLIEIGAKSDKPEEAAKIANAVVEAYTQYRLETRSNEMAYGMEVLKQKYAKEDNEIHESQARLQQMETPKSVKQADVPLTPPPATNAPIPQPEIQTSDNAFSTFSMNVSDVSFKLAMASLQKGQMPDPASIRSEEFINAFDYHDPEPLQGEPLAFTSERASDPFAQERDLLRFSIKAAAAGRQDGRALNLVLLLDTSGSMERADRVAIIREALRVLSAQLQPHDVVSVVTFARTARLWADGIPGDQAGATLDKVGSITPEGGTNLEEAMRLAYETALRHFIAGGMNRVVMLTDGAANLGDVDPQALTQTVESERRQGIALDCFGIGWDDYNDDLLAQLSSNGDGRYAFINSPDEAATEFAAKLAGALEVAAEDVKVQVEFNPNRVTAWRQIGYAKHQLTKEQFRDNSVAAGAIASREAGNALYVIETDPNGQGPIATVRVRYRVPGTQNNYERSWLVDYTGAATELAQSSPAMRLAASAAEISEWMAGSPFAQDVTPDDLLNYLSGVPQFYGTDERPKQLEWLIREAKSVSGK